VLLLFFSDTASANVLAVGRPVYSPQQTALVTSVFAVNTLPATTTAQVQIPYHNSQYHERRIITSSKPKLVRRSVAQILFDGQLTTLPPNWCGFEGAAPGKRTLSL
jgi:hypothetical protein